MLNWKLAGTALGVIAFIAAPTASASAASGPHTSAGSDVASSTKANALTAMHGEAFAYAKYGAYAGQAARTGKTMVAMLFTRTAGVELGDHYASEAKVAGLVGSNRANLQDAITGETYEWQTMYPGFAAQAKRDGCPKAAALFTEIANDEAGHAAAYTTALRSLSNPNVQVPAPQVVVPVTITRSTPACSGQTLTNLLDAMHGDRARQIGGEAFAYAKYNLYADHAQQTGHPSIAKLFRGTAQVELREHFAGEAVLAGLVGSNWANLTDAITGETYAAQTMYPGFARQAAKAGDRHAAWLFSEIANDEAGHAAAFTAARHRL
jgi:rubrerythrin